MQRNHTHCAPFNGIFAPVAAVLLIAVTGCGSGAGKTDNDAVTDGGMVTEHTLHLAWTDNSDNEAGFEVQRRLENGGTFAQLTQLAAGQATFDDVTVELGTSYCYRVRAFNAAGNSAFTNEACGAPVVGMAAVVRVAR